jgi:multiple sugar transport system permease protein
VIRRSGLDGLRSCVLTVGAVAILVPFGWMVLTSFKPPAEIFTTELRVWPAGPTLENYRHVFRTSSVALYLLNSVATAGLILACQVTTIVPAAYAFAKLRFPGRAFCFYAVLGTMMIPAHVTMIPNFVTVHRLGWLDTYWGLAAPFLTSGFGIFLLRQQFLTVPDSLLDAARVDGASSWRILWQVMVPLSWPALSAFAIFSFVTHWNDYFWPLLVVKRKSLYTVPLALAALQNQEAGTLWGQLMAAAVLGVAPLLVVFLVAQRRFIEGFTFTGIRG